MDQSSNPPSSTWSFSLPCGQPCFSLWLQLTMHRYAWKELHAMRKKPSSFCKLACCRQSRSPGALSSLRRLKSLETYRSPALLLRIRQHCRKESFSRTGWSIFEYSDRCSPIPIYIWLFLICSIVIMIKEEPPFQKSLFENYFKCREYDLLPINDRFVRAVQHSILQRWLFGHGNKW